ncbi:MAG: hypothetical protein UR79_C0001G0119 [Candidatus Campbellbacteria bacterium GW2011_GWD1_35_49]|nr:MAG: hypothetical protein UR74_C0001G0210 [Candidatus Campbellbacteria bacterium GW2011_GWD2_35_24]KKP76085.1 MAG: hypothetical protein UR75_C0001G0119 [Candidatus Campbellbacteria bacterium GW2011_GWC2_35_28]KKP77274.1 MAG: hypothetical protein UR76_C0001G0119 [Candidatus Campbellbacteria bacterium GW2011_GWC1_35_31]KKP79203.1 MAG: hypothetical protein UR79_C0001G0119 [Candidatus Campbellbacteria bacterium GW2011_GWD1_35_49]HAP73816.1 hypothetical protein [Candidatus Campbellbacteria bacter
MHFAIKLVSSMDLDQDSHLDEFYARRLFRHKGPKKGGVRVFYEGFFAVFQGGLRRQSPKGVIQEMTIYHMHNPDERTYYPPKFPGSEGIDWTLNGDYRLRQFLEEKEVGCYFVDDLKNRAMNFAEKNKQKPVAIFVTWIKEPWKTEKQGLLGWMEIENYVICFPQKKVVDKSRHCLIINEWDGGDNKVLLSGAIKYLEKHTYYPPPPPPKPEPFPY